MEDAKASGRGQRQHAEESRVMPVGLASHEGGEPARSAGLASSKAGRSLIIRDDGGQGLVGADEDQRQTFDHKGRYDQSKFAYGSQS